MTPAIVLIITATAVLFGFSLLLAQWVRSDGNPRNRPQRRAQDEWSDLPSRPYAA